MTLACSYSRSIAECRRLAAADADATATDILTSDAVRSYFADWVAQLNRTATGSATRVGRIRLLDVPPSLDVGEITDKGAINQAIVRRHRATLVDHMYDEFSDDRLVIRA
ncbi:hypothetical protein ABH945_005751 [Paraburkholderia sp. GAS333]